MYRSYFVVVQTNGLGAVCAGSASDDNVARAELAAVQVGTLRQNVAGTVG